MECTKVVIIFLYDIIVFMTEAETIQKKIQEYFSQKKEIDTVLLYGSFAKNTFNEHSDVDIAIHCKNELTYENLSSTQTDLSFLLHREVDLADLSKAEGIFLYQIMTTAKKIKIDRNVFVRYLVKALCFREDFLPTVEKMQDEKIRRFVNG